jgi:hypothetical protein
MSLYAFRACQLLNYNPQTLHIIRHFSKNHGTGVVLKRTVATVKRP